MYQPLAAFADQHEDLDSAFRAHQIALMTLDLPLALEKLRWFSRLLLAHMSVEEKVLIPEFEERGGNPTGIGPEMIRRDHAKLLEQLERIGARVEELSRREHVGHDEAIDLFDLEHGFKRLLHHHDERERLGMFRWLDDELSKAELDRLWRRVEALRHGQDDPGHAPTPA